MTDLTRTVGLLAFLFARIIGKPESFTARQLRTLLQRESIIPTERSGDGEVKTALFDDEAMARAMIILVLNSRYLPHDELKAAYRCLDNVAHEDKGPAGKLAINRFGKVLDRVRDGEDWFFNFYTSPFAEPGGVLSRKPLPVPPLMPGYTSMIVPLSEHVAPLFTNDEPSE